MSNTLRARMADSASDFILGVQPILEKRLNATIYPIEGLKQNELIKKFDQSGIDSFYSDQQGHLRGLASRFNYSEFAATKPQFTFRYRLWDKRKNGWDDNREFQRKLQAANAPEELIFFPKLHVESYGKSKGSGKIGWSFAAETKDILNFIVENLHDPRAVNIFQPTTGEKRQVITLSVEEFAKAYEVMELGSTKA